MFVVCADEVAARGPGAVDGLKKRNQEGGGQRARKGRRTAKRMHGITLTKSENLLRYLGTPSLELTPLSKLIQFKRHVISVWQAKNRPKHQKHKIKSNAILVVVTNNTRLLISRRPTTQASQTRSQRRKFRSHLETCSKDPTQKGGIVSRRVTSLSLASGGISAL